MNDAMIESMFPTLVGILADEKIQAILTIEQKRAILESVNVSVEEVNDTHVRMTMLFIVLDIDMTDTDNPKINVSMDLGSLLKLGQN